MVLEPGILAKSRAGRDKDCIYVIISVNDEYVYLADGKKRTIRQAKKELKARTADRYSALWFCH